MKRRTTIYFFALFTLLLSACQQSASSNVSATSNDPAVTTVQAALTAIQAGNLKALNDQLSTTEQASGNLCPNGNSLSCAQTMYKGFAADQHAAVQTPVSMRLSLFPKQTVPNVKMVLAEGNWGGNPVITSCQVFYVMQYGSSWLIESYDNPGLSTCQQRGAQLEKNLFG